MHLDRLVEESRYTILYMAEALQERTPENAIAYKRYSLVGEFRSHSHSCLAPSGTHLQ